MIDRAILKVNKTSSAAGGSGNTIIASMSKIIAGVPSPLIIEAKPCGGEVIALVAII
jgi:hypothetical protein